MRPFLALVLILAACLVSGCAGGPVPPSGTPTEAMTGGLPPGAVPEIRPVVAVDTDRLFQAGCEVFEEERIAVARSEPDRGFIESRLIEWEENGFAHRTRIALQVKRDEAGDGGSFGVVALLIEPAMDFAGAEDGRSIEGDWRCVGSNEGIQKRLADRIWQRYLKLRHEGGRPALFPGLGGPPDDVPPAPESAPPPR